MWTLIRNNSIEEYLSQYPYLREYWDKFELLKTNDFTIVPKLFINNFPSKYLQEYNGKKKNIIEKISFKFTKDLRKLQKEAKDVAIQYYKEHSKINGIFKLPPGAGKTYLAVMFASLFKVKTCVIVNKKDLLRQWTDSILDCSDLTIDDIGLVHEKHFTLNKPISLCMAQTLLSKLKTDLTETFQKIQSEGIGLVIYDEVHSTSSSEQFSKVSLLFDTDNVIGLSATPFHTGESKILMNNTIGEIIYESKEYEVTPKFKFILYNSGLSKITMTTKKNKKIPLAKYIQFFDDYIMRKTYYNQFITQSSKYGEMILKYTKDLLDCGHKIIILAMTNAQVDYICNILTNNNIEHRKRTRINPEFDKDNDRILVTTYKLSGEAFDYPALSALIYASPLAGKKSVIQTTGRILRDYKGKTSPVIIDLLDADVPIIFNDDYKKKLDIINNEWKQSKIEKINMLDK